MTDPADRVYRYCRRRAGDDLRGVVSYGPDAEAVVYLRDDIEAKASPDDPTSTMERAREFHRTVESAGDLQPALGAPEASVNVFDGAIVMHLYVDEASGVIVTFERRVGRELTAFVSTLLERLHGDDAGS